MKNFESYPLLLLLMVNLAITKHPNGLHTLRIEHTILSCPVLPEPQSIYVSYVDDTLIMGFNSRSENQRVESRAPWMNGKTAEYWDVITENVQRDLNSLKNTMKKMLHIYNDSMTEYHTIQKRHGCQVKESIYFSHAFMELRFNNHDYIALNEDMKTFRAVGKAAEILKEQWNKENFEKAMKSYLMDICVDMLLEYLNLGKTSLLRTDTPKIHVTHKIKPDRKITLRCWVFNFYPPEITLTWQRDGSNETQDMEVIETRPSGDGTFQKWAAVVVSAGEEHKYTCHVNHEGLSQPITLRWEPPQPIIPFMAMVVALVLGAVLMGSVMTFFIWKRRSRGKNGAGS
ncbi:class I histocompatibility antigen, Gogo-A*0501 alpha chain-like isoform X2 [Mus pahari]|uniref:class I histocompatibility antigen, Gogo-A*0501 alpha chain-like isoform X2 n=1 Tax=Mus pahari TaxID=10093 RepID=UPI001114991F|nr:class I histocompatibility antigen, Gogo-A*0501 alpha chain-like isoform X2 [Mus pahari]